KRIKLWIATIKNSWISCKKITKTDKNYLKFK
ncbi:MAG: hypothetical protein XE08_0308, partial [Parcubacteria bacterium 32_520]